MNKTTELVNKYLQPYKIEEKDVIIDTYRGIVFDNVYRSGVQVQIPDLQLTAKSHTERKSFDNLENCLIMLRGYLANLYWKEIKLGIIETSKHFDKKTVSLIYDILGTQLDLFKEKYPSSNSIQGMELAVQMIFDILATLNQTKGE